MQPVSGQWDTCLSPPSLVAAEDPGSLAQGQSRACHPHAFCAVSPSLTLSSGVTITSSPHDTLYHTDTVIPNHHTRGHRVIVTDTHSASFTSRSHAPVRPFILHSWHVVRASLFALCLVTDRFLRLHEPASWRSQPGGQILINNLSTQGSQAVREALPLPAELRQERGKARPRGRGRGAVRGQFPHVFAALSPESDAAPTLSVSAAARLSGGPIRRLQEGAPSGGGTLRNWLHRAGGGAGGVSCGRGGASWELSGAAGRSWRPKRRLPVRRRDLRL